MFLHLNRKNRPLPLGRGQALRNFPKVDDIVKAGEEIKGVGCVICFLNSYEPDSFAFSY